MKSLFYIVFVLMIGQSHFYGQVSDFSHIDFKKADSIALSLSSERLTNLPELSLKLTEHLDTDVERFRAIYRWVCDNIANDYSLYLKNSRKRQRYKDDSLKFKAWNTKFRQIIFKNLLKRERTICTGYAYLVKTLSDLANIDCEIAQGYGRVSTTNIDKLNLPNHSWNAVKLNDKWYLCDPTWASGIPNPETNRFKFAYNDGFFLTNPKLFAVNHFPVDSTWWLLNDTIPTFDQFLGAPVIYGNTYKHLEFVDQPKQMHHDIKKHQSLNLVMTVKANLNKEDLHLLIDNGIEPKKVNLSSINIEGKQLKLSHTFDKLGFYDVHLYIKNDLIATYTVDVAKN